MPDKNLINFKLYSDDQNSSYLPYISKCTFEILWQKPSLFIEDELTPYNLAIKDSILLIWYNNRIDLRRKEDGVSVWNTEILPIATFDLKEEGFVTINNFGYYQLINLDNKNVSELSLPFLSIQTRLYFSERSGKQMSYCYQVIPTPTNAPGDRFEGPKFIFAKFFPEDRKFVWQFVQKEIIKTVLRTTDKKKILIVTENNVYIFDSAATSDDQVKKLEIGNILGASLDHSGNLLIYLEDKEGKYELRNLTDNGDINWSYGFEMMPSLQPPASHPEGNIYTICGNKLECIQNGRGIWSYQLPSEPGKALLTILKDASVLVSSGQLILHISPDGVLLKQRFFDAKLTCRPIIDTNENIFVATQHNIYCMK